MSSESLMRVAGRDEGLSSVVARAQLRPLPITLASPASNEDYALLDLSLSAEPGAPALYDNAPVVGLGYAGFTPRQQSIACLATDATHTGARLSAIVTAI
jgi:hypothetical protein